MDWLEKIPEFLKMGWSEFAKVMIGAFIVGFLALNWVRKIKEAANEKQARAKAEADAQVAAAREEAHRSIEARTAALHDVANAARSAEAQLRNERDTLESEVVSLRKRLEEIESFDGKLWERPLLIAPPDFVPASQRGTRFIAVANLKGGVGKTTVAANAGMMLAKRGKRVLLVDLDFQGSLTRLCINFRELRSVVNKKETIRALFDLNHAPVGDWLTRIIRPVEHGPEGSGVLDFIPASDDLADAELREETRCIVRRDPDGRFLFRRLLHTPDILNRYDYVFFDCPPRLTAASVNAWACSDWLLVPMVMDQQSVQALPRTLQWLQRMPHVCHARLMGLVANQAKFHGGRLVNAYQTALNQLPAFLAHNGFPLNGAFQATVKADACIGAYVGKGQIPAASGDAEPLFRDLTDKIERVTNP